MRFRKDFLLDQASSWHDKHQSCISNESSIQQANSDSNGCTLSSSRGMIGLLRRSKERVVKGNARNCNPKCHDKFHSSNNRMQERFDCRSCSCNEHSDYKRKDGYQILQSDQVVISILHTQQKAHLICPGRSIEVLNTIRVAMCQIPLSFKGKACWRYSWQGCFEYKTSLGTTECT